MSNQDPLDVLREANPHPASDASEPQPYMGFDAHLKEIMMTTVTTPTNLEKPSLPRKWLPRAVLPLTGAAALITGLTVAGPFGSTNPAYAQVQSAAEASADHDSGQILIEIDFDVLDEEPELEGATGTQTFTFDDGRSHLLSEFGDEQSEEIRIGRDVYHRGYWFIGDSEAPDEFILSDKATTAGDLTPDIDPEASKPENILPLLKKSDDFKQTSSGGSTDVFSGTVAVSELTKLDADDVPAGLSTLVMEDEAENLPETVEVEVVVEDEDLSRLKIEIEGGTALGDIDATITTTFSDFGEPQEIVAPPEDQVISEEDFFGKLDEVDPAILEAQATLDEFQKAKPDVCKREWETMGQAEDEPLSFDEYEEQVVPLVLAWVTCLESEAPVEVAEAARLLHIG